MGYRENNNLVAEVKERTSIVSILENYITLKKVGKDYIGLCPFHDDKNPSMRVNDDKGLFHCFACGEGGDVIAFYMKYNNLDFASTLKELADKVGIKYESYESLSKLNKKDRNKSGKLYKINLFAEKYYHKYLIESNSGKNVLEYLAKRGLDIETIRTFKLGYSPNRWTSLLDMLRKKNVPIELVEKTGIIIKKNNSPDYYDRFRGRIIFPIYDLNNNISGFGGRTVIDDNAKYLNSPESDIYNKSKILYGLNHTRSHIKQKGTAIIVEGYMDLLTLYSSGVKNVVATLGTSITSYHVSLLKRITDKVVLAFDGDTAGVNASYRAMDKFQNEGIMPYAISMPEGEDPASYIVNHGNEQFSSLIDKAVPVMDLFFEDNLSLYNSNRKTRSAAINDLIERLNNMSDGLDRSYYVKKISELFGIREDSIYTLLKTSKTSANRSSRKLSADKSYEFMFLKVLIMFPILKEELNHEILDLIKDNSIKKILDVYLDYEEDISYILNCFDDLYIKSILTEIYFSSDEISDLNTGRKIFNDCLKRIRLKGIKDELRIIKHSLSKSAEESENEELIQKYRDLVKKEKDLNNQIYEI